jgi:hypothetical protein
MSDWQPIETAPKDGTAIILAVPTEHRDGFIVGEGYFAPENLEGGDWWWAGVYHSDYYGGPISEMNHWPPSHWQPLPEPPQVSA